MLQIATQSNQKIHWFQADVANWIPTEHYDLIYSNAALHWVDQHEQLFPHLMAYLKPGGVLAVQMPAHYHSSLHQALLEVARHPEWRRFTEPACQQFQLNKPSFYYDLLAPIASEIQLWETDYIHLMDDIQDIWFRGTGLRPFLEALAEQRLQDRFEQTLAQQYAKIYPKQANGRILFPFRRFFFVAHRSNQHQIV